MRNLHLQGVLGLSPWCFIKFHIKYEMGRMSSKEQNLWVVFIIFLLCELFFPLFYVVFMLYLCVRTYLMVSKSRQPVSFIFTNE